MRTHIVVFEHFGENNDSAKSPTFKKPEDIDLTEQKVCCLNWDDNQLVDTNRYAPGKVRKPSVPFVAILLPCANRAPMS